jgi:multiple antibiotic resistance protein
VDAFIIVAFTTLITIVNPLGALGPFLVMTVTDSATKRRDIAKRASLTCTGILIGCALAGSFVFRFYGITLPALKIAGGILLFFIAFDMVNARPSRMRQTDEEESEGVAKDDVAVFPLAIPLLAGPGSIVSIFILSDQANSALRTTSLYLAIMATGLISYLLLREAPRLVSYMGAIGMNVLGRLQGILLAASAVQFVLDGIKTAFPGVKLF